MRPEYVNVTNAEFNRRPEGVEIITVVKSATKFLQPDKLWKNQTDRQHAANTAGTSYRPDKENNGDKPTANVTSKYGSQRGRTPDGMMT